MKFATPVLSLVAASGAGAFVHSPAAPRAAKTSLPSYLDNLGGAPTVAKPSSSGIADYLSSIPSTIPRISGEGIPS